MRRHFRISRIVLQPATSETFAFRMDSQLDNPKRKPLVTVEFQTEVDIATGNRERRMFVKMYFDARDSGLLAALPDELWKTLCCLATYMDENGNCYPSQARLASDLGIRREHMNKRIKRLLAFRFHGEPVITMTKSRESKRGGSRWANNIYRLRSITGLAMFAEADALNPQMEADRASVLPQGHIESASSVCAEGHTEVQKSRPVCDSLCDPRGHTNQIEPDRTKTLNVNGFRKALSEGQTANGSLSAAETIRVGSLVIEMLDVCRDKHSRGFYRLVAQKVPEELIRAALSETKYQDRMGRITKSRGAFFTDQLRRLARERGIELVLKMPAQNGKCGARQST
jgi:hypothetical protein